MADLSFSSAISFGLIGVIFTHKPSSLAARATAPLDLYFHAGINDHLNCGTEVCGMSSTVVKDRKVDLQKVWGCPHGWTGVSDASATGTKGMKVWKVGAKSRVVLAASYLCMQPFRCLGKREKKGRDEKLRMERARPEERKRVDAIVRLDLIRGGVCYHSFHLVLYFCSCLPTAAYAASQNYTHVRTLGFVYTEPNLSPFAAAEL